MSFHRHNRSRKQYPSNMVKATRGRLFQIQNGKSLRVATEHYLDLCGFRRQYSADEFQSTLAGLREQAFQVGKADDFKVIYHLSETLSKWQGGAALQLDVTAEERKHAALQRFYEAEAQCAIANKRLQTCPYNASPNWKYVERAAKIVKAILGPCDLNRIIPHCRFGPGASTSLKARFSSLQNKWQNSRHVTASALPYCMAYSKLHPGYAEIIQQSWEVVQGNHVTTVPKDWEKDRVIAIEPDWNMFFQLGFGGYIRSRLNRVGLLRPDAQEYHGVLAWIGSRYGKLATLDLKAASDTVSHELVKLLLPPDWFAHLKRLRSPGGLVEGKYRRYNKFSSMGNGYTFELETLIFYALASAVVAKTEREEVSVYGDDIIVPSSRVEVLKGVLDFCGLTLNMKKSFWGDHPFRESCGKHYFRGVDVTPFYLRHDLKTCGDLAVLANHCKPDFPTVWEYAYRLLPPTVRCPIGHSDGLQCEWDKARPVYDNAHQAFVYCSIRREHIFQNVQSWSGSYVYKLWMLDHEQVSGFVPDNAAVTSRLTRANSRETTSLRYVCRTQWA